MARAEAKLGCKVPGALREFYRVAGRAGDFTDHYDHFLQPTDWWLADGKLIFLTENQDVVLYAVDTARRRVDPPVLMTSSTGPFAWHGVCARCSEFLRVMVHWEAAFGGALAVGGSALVPQAFESALRSLGVELEGATERADKARGGARL